MKLYKRIATALEARRNCEKTGNELWFDNWTDTLDKAIGQLPHGSGLDGKTELSELSTPNKLIVTAEYHCMNENGYYDGWINLTIAVIPSLTFDFELKITGRFGKYQDVKDYLYDIFNEAFNSDFIE